MQKFIWILKKSWKHHTTGRKVRLIMIKKGSIFTQINQFLRFCGTVGAFFSFRFSSAGSWNPLFLKQKVQLPVLGNNPERISSSAYKAIIPNMFWSKCHSLLTTCWPPASAQLIEVESKQASRKQTQTLIDWQESWALQALIPAPQTWWKNQELSARSHNMESPIRANALDSLHANFKLRC